jgi:hypothetical protein
VDLSFRHDLWYLALPRSPRDVGRVHRCVVRPRDGERLTPEAIELSREGGIAGDSWGTSPRRRPTNQVSLMNVHVLRAVAGGDEARMALSGDNLQVDLDLGQENLPPGTLLEIGSARLLVTDDPHRPCKLFAERFGALGAKRVARGNRVGRRARGVLCRIDRPGTIRVGDAIRVLRPGTAAP